MNNVSDDQDQLTFILEELIDNLNNYHLYSQEHIDEDVPLSQYFASEKWAANNQRLVEIFDTCCQDMKIFPEVLKKNDILDWVKKFL